MIIKQIGSQVQKSNFKVYTWYSRFFRSGVFAMCQEYNVLNKARNLSKFNFNCANSYIAKNKTDIHWF